MTRFGQTKRADYTEHQKSAGAWLSLQNDVLCNRLWRSKSGSASYSSRQQNQRRGGAVRHFRYTDTVSDEPTNYVSIWSNISIQLLCSGVPLCHYYTDNVLWRQACKAPHCIRNHRERKSTVTEKVLLLVRTFSEKYQRAKIILSNLGRILRINFPTTCREYKTHFQPSWSEVLNPTSAQLGQKSKITSPQFATKWDKQLRYRLCRS